MDVIEHLEKSKIRQALSRYFKLCSAEADINLCADASNELYEIGELAKLGKQMQWINVKDRLPELEDVYLVALSDGKEKAVTMEAFFSGFSSLVTHWMPLPKGAE